MSSIMISEHAPIKSSSASRVMKKLCEFLVILVVVQWTENVSGDGYANITRSLGLKSRNDRQKRFILFDNGGICKIVVGFAVAVDTVDKKPWRSLILGYNLQAQYAVPPDPIYWWDKWNGRSLADAKQQYNRDGTYHKDESRQFIYAMIEQYASRAGKNGKKCLLRAICDNAGVHEVEGIYMELLQAVLTPGEDADEEYIHAYRAGKYGAVCTSLYPECPEGEGIFDSIFFTQTTHYFGRK